MNSNAQQDNKVIQQIQEIHQESTGECTESTAPYIDLRVSTPNIHIHDDNSN